MPEAVLMPRACARHARGMRATATVRTPPVVPKEASDLQAAFPKVSHYKGVY